MAVAVALVSLLTRFQNCTVIQDSDRCSIPFGFHVPFKDEFTPACLHHDACYGCGGSYGWTQTQCDTAFRKLMHSFCIKDLKESRRGRRNKRFISNFLRQWKKMVELKKNILEGWRRATNKITSSGEIKRVQSALREMMSLISKWFFASNRLDECKKSADIFHKVVETFGVYSFRYTNKTHCAERCVKKLIEPFIVQPNNAKQKLTGGKHAI
uniref:Uncharacterized protein n=1 Tax=Clytia hemisphaerica TaxID=252671 RepID=A0A7M5UUF2_9CNID